MSASFKGRQEYYSAAAGLIPLQPTLVNYQYVLTQLANFPTYLRNSLIVTCGAMAIIAAFASPAAYAFARMRFPGRDAIFFALLLSIFAPHVGGNMMAVYELMSLLGLRNNLIGLILYFGAMLPVPIFILRQAFLALPRELEDAAVVDGAGWFRVFWNIALPIASNALVLVMILVFVNVWGDFLITFILIDRDASMTISVGVQKVLVDPFAQATTPGFAGLFSTEAANAAVLLIASTPVILVYLFLQRFFMRGLIEGALKF